MNATEKRKFIRSLTAAVRDDLLGKVKYMPEEWDGHELRQLLGEKFVSETTSSMKGKRLRDYDEIVATKNL